MRCLINLTISEPCLNYVRAWFRPYWGHVWQRVLAFGDNARAMFRPCLDHVLLSFTYKLARFLKKFKTGPIWSMAFYFLNHARAKFWTMQVSCLTQLYSQACYSPDNFKTVNFHGTSFRTIKNHIGTQSCLALISRYQKPEIFKAFSIWSKRHIHGKIMQGPCLDHIETMYGLAFHSRQGYETFKTKYI